MFYKCIKNAFMVCGSFILLYIGFLFASGKTLYFNIISCISSVYLCISSNIHILLCFILFLYVSLVKEILTT